VNVTIQLRNNETGEIRTHADNFASPSPKTRLWLWTEDGNSCDCNRSLLWGEEWEGFFQPPCTNGGYSARIVETNTGEVLLDEFDRPWQADFAERIRRLRYAVKLYRDNEPGALQDWVEAHPE
jgi:hypothetical protein